jgi:peptidoglycan/LPS O-acetylase OafA/YrhL
VFWQSTGIFGRLPLMQPHHDPGRVCGPLSWNSVSWSLSAEWISFPILLRPVLSCPRWMAGVLVLGCAGIIIAISPITRYDIYRMGALYRSLPEFLAGMILYRAYCDKWLAHWGYFVGAIVVLVSALGTHAPGILVSQPLPRSFWRAHMSGR